MQLAMTTGDFIVKKDPRGSFLTVLKQLSPVLKGRG